MILGGADLRGIDLSDADLRGADLRGADLRGAKLSAAKLSAASIDSNTQFMNAIVNNAIIFPLVVFTDKNKYEWDGKAFAFDFQKIIPVAVVAPLDKFLGSVELETNTLVFGARILCDNGDLIPLITDDSSGVFLTTRPNSIQEMTN